MGTAVRRLQGARDLRDDGMTETAFARWLAGIPAYRPRAIRSAAVSWTAWVKPSPFRRSGQVAVRQAGCGLCAVLAGQRRHPRRIRRAYGPDTKKGGPFRACLVLGSASQSRPEFLGARSSAQVPDLVLVHLDRGEIVDRGELGQ